MNRKRKMEKKLPLVTGPGTVVTGFVPDDYMARGDPLWPYGPCCQDPANWEGLGPFRSLISDDKTPDPYVLKGYRSFRDVSCVICGTRINATEYSVEDAP